MRTGTNIRQRTDGRFEARYAKGRNEQGRIVYGYCYGKTYEEAAKKREEMLRERKPVREMNLLILGAGSHGAEVYELAQSLGIFRKIAFLDDDPAKDVLGTCSDLEQYVEEYPIAIPAIGNAGIRTRWMQQLIQAGFILPVLIHPTAVVSPSTNIGYGTVICARATIAAGAVIGNGCIISSGATIDRFVKIPDESHITCGQVIMAGTKL